jgi:stage V sporulation protein D (sporulation-specific penicillin-binding protein)
MFSYFFIKNKKRKKKKKDAFFSFSRIFCIIFFVFGSGLYLLYSLYTVQIVRGDEYHSIAKEQHKSGGAVYFDRGSIFFTNKDGKYLTVANVRHGYLLALNPNQIESRTEASLLYDALSPFLSISRDVFMSRATKENDPYEEIAHYLSEEDAEKIRALRKKGVNLFPQQWRVYAGGTLAAHTIGFLGYTAESHEKNALYGIERYWDQVLERKTSARQANVFASLFDSGKEKINSEGGKENQRNGDIITGIEPLVQKELEEVLKNLQEKWNSKKVGGIIIHPKTGKIYALGIHPTFNLNEYSSVPDASFFRNSIVEDVFEMGSIIKPIAMAIGIDEGAVKRKTLYTDKGSVIIDGYTIRNYDNKARGDVSMQEVLNQSLNTGMAFVTEKVGGEKMAKRLLDFGLSEETGIDIPFEARGLTRNFENDRLVEYVTASFGQGIALTPIATVRALSALANGGFLINPHIVESIRRNNGEIVVIAPKETKKVLEKSTSEEITHMLVEVFDTALKGGAVKKEGYSIAAKTGTAQIPKKDSRGYSEDKFLHSFFGYFPAYHPEFLIFLYHSEPENVRYASETLTDPFIHLVDFLIHYYNIPPDR